MNNPNEKFKGETIAKANQPDNMPEVIYANDAGKGRSNFDGSCKGGVWSIFPDHSRGRYGKPCLAIQKYKRTKYIRADLVNTLTAAPEPVEALKSGAPREMRNTRVALESCRATFEILLDSANAKCDLTDEGIANLINATIENAKATIALLDRIAALTDETRGH